MPTPFAMLVATCCVSWSGRKFVHCVESRHTFEIPRTGSTFVVDGAPPEIGPSVPLPSEAVMRSEAMPFALRPSGP